MNLTLLALAGVLLLETTASRGSGKATIRSVLDYRPSTGATAVTSWRVCALTGC